ncbi:MAG: pyridoxal-phosphate-dependent aminotransferase family protein [Planctomycetota bacterium]|jgi:alanine-glyoxylate transaminase/serine-glyoxylate transaminase/serine-pyruvate transaminase
MNTPKTLKRILMGPGPSDVDPRVLEAMSRPTIGHLDPAFLDVLNEIRELLQYTFQTGNDITFAVSGTGSAGMETCVVNLIEPGDSMLVCINGVFGKRMADVAQRCDADTSTIETDWGKAFAPEQIADALKKKPAKVVGIVHAETSTGVCQPLEKISRIVHENGALLLVDAVTSLGGMNVDVDGWKIDACYSGTQKCLSCPPGLSPVTFNDAAVNVIENRKVKVRSWYLDISMIRKYWGSERLYHHTAPINMNYALLEALKIVKEEGLQQRWARHLANHKILKAGLSAIGFDYIPEPGYQLPMLNAVSILAGTDDVTLRKQLLNEFNIEIGGGLGAFKAKAWRIGLMGTASTPGNVLLFLSALEKCLTDQGVKFEKGASIAAAIDQAGSEAKG